jgi:hypothetical protein
MTIASSSRADPFSAPSPPPTFLSLDIPFFLFLFFFGLTARVIPLRSALRVFCFVGSAPNNTRFPPTKLTLACDSTPPRSLSCPKEKRVYGELLFRQATWDATLLHPFLYVIDFKRALSFGEAQV